MGKVILITGGTGSLGTALVNNLLHNDSYSAIRILTNNEAELVAMEHELGQTKLRFMVGDVRDRDRMNRIMNGVQEVVHAAALKHVPICEFNPIEAVKTNIMGSINVIEAAIDNNVEKVIAISSDKAVHPINIYGATKLTMEKLFVQANVYGKTKFSCIRFGNFRGSRGSVLPLWYEQLENNEPITVTEKEMTRYWITLDNASEFVIECIDMMIGGEIFIPKMPEENLMELAEVMAGEQGFRFIGKRPGEKLHELLFNEDEKPEDHDGYFVIKNDNS